MRKIIIQMMTTIDGFFEGPDRELDWHNVDKEFLQTAIDMLNSADTILFGRVTYQMMAAYWPDVHTRENDPIIAGKMNGLSKIVFSKTLDSVEWENTSLIKENIKETIIKLKR